METHLYLVRHGETDWNRDQRLQGTLDVPLNSAGVAQARRLADYFVRIPIMCIVSSPLARASATAAILAEACACPHTTDVRLREIDHGMWSGRTLPELGQRFPALVKDEQLLPEAFEVSRGEPLLAVYRRASAALADLLDAYGGQSVVVVGHGVTLAAMWCAATGLEIARLLECQPPNTGGVVLTFSQHHLVDARVMAVAEIPA
ncbi:MAG: histidine phosphatase family protein [Gemmatimonas sp.]